MAGTVCSKCFLNAGYNSLYIQFLSREGNEWILLMRCPWAHEESEKEKPFDEMHVAVVSLRLRKETIHDF